MEHELNATAIQRSRMSESLSISSNMSFIVGKKARREEDVIEVEEDTLPLLLLLTVLRSHLQVPLIMSIMMTTRAASL